MRFPAPSRLTMARADCKRRKPTRRAMRAARLMLSAREGSDGHVESLKGDGPRDGCGHGDGAGPWPRRRELVGHRSRSRPTGPIADEPPLGTAAETGEPEARRVAEAGRARGDAGGADSGGCRRL